MTESSQAQADSLPEPKSQASLANSSPNTQNIEETKENASSVSSTTMDAVRADPEQPRPPQYCALSPSRRRFILVLVTLAGLVGPLSGAIYLPVLPLLEREFDVGSTSINATVSVFMVTFAFAVRTTPDSASFFFRINFRSPSNNIYSRCFGRLLLTAGADGPCM